MTPPLPKQSGSEQTLRLRLSYLLAILMVLASGTLTYRAASDFAESSLGVQHAYSVLEGVQSIEIQYSRTVSTLRAYLEQGRNKSAGAAAAHLSRPAFYERLARIGRILAVDLDSVETCLSLHVALLALDAIRTP